MTKTEKILQYSDRAALYCGFQVMIMRVNYHMALLSVLLMLSAVGCEKTETESVQPETAPPTTQATEVPATEPQTEPATELSSGINPLTGETGYPAEAVGKRPVAIMVNNLKNAYPQYGISEADILYELPVEGGVTRMMAVYADMANVPDVGSVRSSRYYFPKIAMGMDAIYCHWGAEQVHAVNVMNQLGIDRFDGAQLEHSILFYRDPERVGKYSSEHTGFLRGSDLPAAVEAYGIRQYAASRATAFGFAEEARVPADEICVGVKIPFSDTSSTEFTLDPSRDVYLMTHNGDPQMDGHAQVQVSFTNVFVLQTQVSSLDESNYLRRIELDGGSGYYISMGGREEIRWEKADDRSPIQVYAADGSELEVNVGSSYIAIIGEGRRISFVNGFDGDAPPAY